MTEFWWTLACGIVLAATSLALGYIIGWERGRQKAVLDRFAADAARERRAQGQRNMAVLQEIIERRKAEHAARSDTREMPEEEA
jgi:hypothetical protein